MGVGGVALEGAVVAVGGLVVRVAVEPAANLARLYVYRNRKDERTRELLEQVVMTDPRPQWRDWARERLALMGPPAPPGPPPGEEPDAPAVE